MHATHFVLLRLPIGQYDPDIKDVRRNKQRDTTVQAHLIGAAPIVQVKQVKIGENW